jgi:uncharacterized protein DUF4013
VDRISDAFTWPIRDPHWVTKTLIIGLILLLPIVGAINGVGWMLAALDRLRAGDETLPPGHFGYLGRGIRLFAVYVVYGLAVVVISAAVYIPAVLVVTHEGRGAVNAGLISVGLLLSLFSFTLATFGLLALNFATPAIVLATERGGIAGGLEVARVLRHARASVINTLIAGLMLIAAGFVGSLGAVACGIGIIFSTAYSLAMQAWIVRSFEVGSKGPLHKEA